jgi:hypothetical protein
MAGSRVASDSRDVEIDEPVALPLEEIAITASATSSLPARSARSSESRLQVQPGLIHVSASAQLVSPSIGRVAYLPPRAQESASRKHRR